MLVSLSSLKLLLDPWTCNAGGVGWGGSSILYLVWGRGNNPEVGCLTLGMPAYILEWVMNIWKILKASKQRKMCFQVFSLRSFQFPPFNASHSETFLRCSLQDCSNHLSISIFRHFFFSPFGMCPPNSKRFKWWNIITHMGCVGLLGELLRQGAGMIQVLLTSLGREKNAGKG